MRQAILTPLELETLEKYLEDHRKNELVRVTRYRADRYLHQLKRHIFILESMLALYDAEREHERKAGVAAHGRRRRVTQAHTLHGSNLAHVRRPRERHSPTT